jgi:hypothetical protein
MTPYGSICQFNLSNDGKGKFRAVLARVYSDGMSAAANSPGANNPHRVFTKKHKAWQAGWAAGVELAAKIAALKVQPGDGE